MNANKIRRGEVAALASMDLQVRILDVCNWPRVQRTDSNGGSRVFRRSTQETDMAKGQMKSNKEAKKPKADKDKPKAGASAYKVGQGKGESAVSSLVKKS